MPDMPDLPKVEMPKPPGYSEYHAQELDDNKVAVKKIDMMALKLKVRVKGVLGELEKQSLPGTTLPSGVVDFLTKLSSDGAVLR